MLRNKLFREANSSDDRRGQTVREKIEIAWGDRAEDNEREARRFETNLIVAVEIDARSYVGFAENLSESGVFVATLAREKVGGLVHLLIALPDLALVRAEGTVRWLRRASEADGRAAGMGIHFERLSALDAVRIHEFAKARLFGEAGEPGGVRLRSA